MYLSKEKTWEDIVGKYGLKTEKGATYLFCLNEGATKDVFSGLIYKCLRDEGKKYPYTYKLTRLFMEFDPSSREWLVDMGAMYYGPPHIS